MNRYTLFLSLLIFTQVSDLNAIPEPLQDDPRCYPRSAMYHMVGLGGATTHVSLETNEDNSRMFLEITTDRERTWGGIKRITCRIGNVTYVIPRELYKGLKSLGRTTHLFAIDEDKFGFVVTHQSGELYMDAYFKIDLGQRHAWREDWYVNRKLKSYTINHKLLVE